MPSVIKLCLCTDHVGLILRLWDHPTIWWPQLLQLLINCNGKPLELLGNSGKRPIALESCTCTAYVIISLKQGCSPWTNRFVSASPSHVNFLVWDAANPSSSSVSFDCLCFTAIQISPWCYRQMEHNGNVQQAAECVYLLLHLPLQQIFPNFSLLLSCFQLFPWNSINGWWEDSQIWDFFFCHYAKTLF